MRPLNLTAKLKDTANASIPELSFQRKAVQDYRSRPVEVSQPAESPNEPPSLTLDAHLHVSCSDKTTSTSQAKRTFSSITSDNVNDFEDGDASSAQPEQCILFYLSLQLFLTYSTVIYSP